MKTFMCLFTILLVSLTYVAIGAAQESDEQTILSGNTLSITGTVTDDEGNPLPGVRVATIVGGKARIAITDLNGAFTFPNLPPGKYDLNFHKHDLIREYNDKELEGIQAGDGELIVKMVPKKKILQVSTEILREWGFTFYDVPPEEDAGVNYQKAGALFVDIPDYFNFPHKEDDRIDRLTEIYFYVDRTNWIPEAEELVPWLKANLPALEEFRKGAQKSVCNIPLYYEEDKTLQPWNTSVPELAHMIALTNFSVFYSSYLIKDNNYPEAVDVLLDSLRASQQLRGGKSFIGYIIGNLTLAISVEKLRRIALADKQIPDEVLSYMCSELSLIVKENPTLVDAFKNERIDMLSILKSYYDNDKELLEKFKWEPLGENPYPQEQANEEVNEFLNLADEIVVMPIHEALVRWEELSNFNSDLRNKQSPASAVVGGLSSNFEYAAFADVRLKVLFTISMLEQYKRKKGEYPASLAELVPEYMDSVPIDAFDGKELRYRLEGQNYMLWSVGPDLKDNNGAIKDKEKGWPMRWENYDYVFTNVLEKPEPFQWPKPEPTDEANEG